MESQAVFRIIPAESQEHLKTVKALFIAYTEWLGIDLTFQDFASELQSLPGLYGAPHGALLLAYDADLDSPLGCVALRPLKKKSSGHHGPASGGDDDGDDTSKRCCEMKRLYVSPHARGVGLGKALVAAIVEKAKDLGYAEMRLDTLRSMRGAIELYKRFGFIEIPPYYETPLENSTIFLALRLT